jgi:hypothetical protein
MSGSVDKYQRDFATVPADTHLFAVYIMLPLKSSPLKGTERPHFKEGVLVRYMHMDAYTLLPEIGDLRCGEVDEWNIL